jgi:hypothetical protein
LPYFFTWERCRCRRGDGVAGAVLYAFFFITAFYISKETRTNFFIPKNYPIRQVTKETMFLRVKKTFLSVKKARSYKLMILKDGGAQERVLAPFDFHH